MYIYINILYSIIESIIMQIATFVASISKYNLKDKRQLINIPEVLTYDLEKYHGKKIRVSLSTLEDV